MKKPLLRPIAICLCLGLITMGQAQTDNAVTDPFDPNFVTPISPPSGPTQWLFQEPPAKSNFLSASQQHLLNRRRGRVLDLEQHLAVGRLGLGDQISV
jgi:hypothetical protein